MNFFAVHENRRGGELQHDDEMSDCIPDRKDSGCRHTTVIRKRLIKIQKTMKKDNDIRETTDDLQGRES